MRLRIRLIATGFIMFGIVIVGRLYYWQIVKNEELSVKARVQAISRRKVTSQRGAVLASDGTWLTASEEAWLLFVDQTSFESDAKKVANMLSPLTVVYSEEEDEDEKQTLLDETNRIEDVLKNGDYNWLPIKHKLSGEIKRNIEAMDIRGLGFDPEEVRIYPEASSSAHVLGFVGKDDNGDDKGYFGLEGYYDYQLSGVDGYVERESSALGVPILTGNSSEIGALKGVDIQTHVNKAIQLIVEKELTEGIEKYGAKSGTVIVVNPENGGIMAMASYPYFDPREYWDYSNEQFKNPSISDSFEPGSIFKPVVMASGLDAGVVEPDTKCDICDKPLKVDKYEIGTWNNEYNADSTMTEVIKNSDNVGMAFVGFKLGDEKLYDYLNKFGFGEYTEIDLQGEANPGLRKKGTWSEVDLATTTFGQGIAVTPIQMVMAVNTIARGGVPVTPQVADKILSNGEIVEDIKPLEGERAISKKAADEITHMMEVAARQGEAKWAIPKGFRIAGKTGTAQIPVAGHYDDEKTIGSFVGFAPANDPKFVMFVSLREPESSQWASETAAPLWFDIARDVFPILGIQPN